MISEQWYHCDQIKKQVEFTNKEIVPRFKMRNWHGSLSTTRLWLFGSDAFGSDVALPIQSKHTAPIQTCGFGCDCHWNGGWGWGLVVAGFGAGFW